MGNYDLLSPSLLEMTDFCRKPYGDMED
jgi:hypothetical protein